MRVRAQLWQWPTACGSVLTAGCFCWQQNVLVCVDKQQFGQAQGWSRIEEKHQGRVKAGGGGVCPGVTVAQACSS